MENSIGPSRAILIHQNYEYNPTLQLTVTSRFQERCADGRKATHDVSNHDNHENHGNMPMIPIMPSAPPLRDPPPAYEDIATQHIRHHQNVFLLEQQESTSDPTYLVVCT